jgi:histidinol phosphatase-like PHP family hydrolase
MDYQTMPDRINLHNHTTFSDGKLTPEELVQAAIEAGLTHIGISDHFRTAKLAGSAQYVISEGMGEYIQAIRALAKTYAAQIKVLVGLEIDFSERTPLDQLWQRGFKNTFLNDLDYVLFEYVGDREWRGLPLSALLSYRRWIQVPVGLAHTLMARTFAALPAGQLAQTLGQQRIFVELSTASDYMVALPSQERSAASARVFYYRYPTPYHDSFFAACRDQDVLFSIGSDTHARREEVGDIADAQAFLAEKGLTGQLIAERYWR